MDIDPQKCPDCGKPFQSPSGAEAVCECGKSLQQQLTQSEGAIVYLLPCPKCGDQKHARPSLIGKTEQCQCGFEFRYSLVLSPLRPEPVGWMPTIRHHATVCTQKSLEWWRQSAVPWIKRTVTYIREHVIPRIVPVTISALNWLANSIGSLFTAPPRSEFENRDVRQESAGTDTSGSRNAVDDGELPGSDSGELRHQSIPRPVDSGWSVPSPRQFHPGADATVRCPRCGSVQVHAEKRGWSVWTGLMGSGKIVLTCLRCSHRFSPGAH